MSQYTRQNLLTNVVEIFKRNLKAINLEENYELSFRRKCHKGTTGDISEQLK